MKEDPRLKQHESEYEILNFLDAEDAEINTTETDNNELLDVEI